MKFPKPLIILMNLGLAVSRRLEEAGYNVETGSFGIPYSTPHSSKIQTLRDNSSFSPHYAEGEVIVIDLRLISTGNRAFGIELRDNNGKSLGIGAPFDIVDTRPYTMFTEQYRFNRILDNGGIFIVFAEPKMETDIYIADPYGTYNLLDERINNWSFLGILQGEDIVTKSDPGSQIQVTTENSVLFPFLQRHLANASFSTTITIEDNEGRWESLAINKFGETVAGRLISQSGTKDGVIYIFPHVDDKAEFILDFVENTLPELAPHLFPYHEGAHWIKEDVYQTSGVVSLTKEIQHLQDETTRKIEELRHQIELEQAKYKYLTDLITETDKPLVHAVKQVLEVIGFKDVLNCDEELEQRGSALMREDLHIRDRSPLILVEVKGVKGTSKESEALQITKYLSPRMQELNRLDLRGLTIINHQRHIPALNRKSQPFNNDVLTNAVEQRFGLLTTWNLYRLVRSYLKLGWSHDQIADLFYKDGFIEPVPSHYQYVGIVEGYMEKYEVVGVQVEQNEICIGDRIAFELPIEFEEQVVESLQLDNNKIKIAQPDMRVAVQTSFSRSQLRDGIRVFRVGQNSSV